MYQAKQAANDLVVINSPGWDGDDWSFIAQGQYESAIVDEARSIVQGAPIKPSKEHLRVLLSWLDGSAEQAVDDSQLALPF